MSQIPDLDAYLSSATIAPEIFALRPDYRALLIAVKNITPASSDDYSTSLLTTAEETVKSLLNPGTSTTAPVAVTALPHIASWREAYKSFGAKPNKTRNSLEALTRRAEKGLPRINRLTDIYNAISVRRQIPFGGEDLEKYVGAPVLVRAKGDEVFYVGAKGSEDKGIGSEEKMEGETVDEGEVVWCDGVGVTCRRWNWRQGPRTALTDDTRHVLFIMDALDACSDDELQAAGDELVEALRMNSPDIEVARRLLRK